MATPACPPVDHEGGWGVRHTCNADKALAFFSAYCVSEIDGIDRNHPDHAGSAEVE